MVPGPLPVDRSGERADTVPAMSERFDFDVAVIGGGSGGYAAARTATAAGLKTVVIEGGEKVGGLCILRGCMPTKALLYAAEVMHLASHPEAWGIRTENVTFDFARVMARMNALVQEFADYRAQQLAAGKFAFIRARARFIDAHTVELQPIERGDSEGSGARAGKRITAGKFVIATGSAVAPPPLPQLADAGYLDSDTALKLTRLPRSLVVLGGGSVAMEFAQFFVRFGVKVTLIQRSPSVLHAMDSDVAEVIQSVLRREGATLYAGTTLQDARRLGAVKEVSFEQEGRVVRVQAGEIFYALGRIPNVASLGLDRAGVALDQGRITTDLHMRTSAPHIFAVGDCAGPYEIVHIAVLQGETAGYNAAHPDRLKAMDYRLVTEVVFTEPQIATVGLTEKRAQAENIPYRAAKYPFNDHGKSLIMEARDGFVKLLADPNSGEIIGGACVGPAAGELIHEIVAAMAKRMTARELAAMPHYHPTLAEIWTYPAEELAEG